jgi:hypothetical protein
LPEAIPRELTQSVIPFGDQELLVRNFQAEHYGSFGENIKYFSLGSTFEEYMYARRRLIFQRNSVRWECRRSRAFEELDKVLADPPWHSDYVEFMFHNGFPSLSVYAKLINLINNREFTPPNDVLSAFAGTLSIPRTPMPGGFLHGLPEMFFGLALL